MFNSDGLLRHEDLLCDLYDIRNMSWLVGFDKLPKDNDGTEFTISDLLDNAIQQLEVVMMAHQH